MMSEREVLEAISEGESAYSLLCDKMPRMEAKFKRLCKKMVDLLDEVKAEFPDACYYTASGGFNLLLGRSHDDKQNPQRDIEALGGSYGVTIGDGDW